MYLNSLERGSSRSLPFARGGLGWGKPTCVYKPPYGDLRGSVRARYTLALPVDPLIAPRSAVMLYYANDIPILRSPMTAKTVVSNSPFLQIENQGEMAIFPLTQDRHTLGRDPSLVDTIVPDSWQIISLDIHPIATLSHRKRFDSLSKGIPTSGTTC